MAQEIFATPVSDINIDQRRDGAKLFAYLLNDGYHSGDIILEKTPNRGDLIRYSQDGAREFYRNDNLAIFDGRHIIPLDYDGPTDYGAPPFQFSFPEFPPTHWKGLLHMDYFPVDGIMLHYHAKKYYVPYENYYLPVLQYGDYHFITPYLGSEDENIGYKYFKWALLVVDEVEVETNEFPIGLDSSIFGDRDVIVLQ